MVSSLIQFDKKRLTRRGGIVGLDEAGRGCFAGPVMAGGAWIKPEFYESRTKRGVSKINDSKQLSAEERELLFNKFLEWEAKGMIAIAWSEGSVEEIEKYNIVGATRLAMKRVLDALSQKMPEKFRIASNNGMPLWDGIKNSDEEPRILIDGHRLYSFEYEHEAIVKGDAKSMAIAMGSIVAKVKRDHVLIEISKKHPGYGFEEHKGYGTKIHQKAIFEKGALPIHRKLYLKTFLEQRFDGKTNTEQIALEL